MTWSQIEQGGNVDLLTFPFVAIFSFPVSEHFPIRIQIYQPVLCSWTREPSIQSGSLMNTLFIRYSSLTNLNYFWKPCPFFPVPIFWEALSNLFPVPACRRGGNPAWSALADFHHKVKQESGQLPFNQMMTYSTLISIYIVIYQGWSG